MTPDDQFRRTYSALEAQMQELAAREGDIYLPNVTPTAPVDWVLICMEPSLGRWASSPAIARARIEAGARNFLYSVEDFLLHLAVRRFLCAPGDYYHITDISKGAMLVSRASVEREARYDRWYGLLIDEIDLVAKPGGGIVAVGGAVARHLTRRGFRRPVTQILHYSGQAGAARIASVRGHETAFQAFCTSFDRTQLIEEAKLVFDASDVPNPFRSEALARVEKAVLSESRLQLLFSYKNAFERLRATHDDRVRS